MSVANITEQFDDVKEAIGVAQKNADRSIIPQAPSEQEKINRFLDGINKYKKGISESTDQIEDIIGKLEVLTWIKEQLSAEIESQLKDLLESCFDAHQTFVKCYINTKELRQRGIAKVEIKRYKGVIDDFKETALDLQTVFFVLPNDKEFQKIAQGLKGL